MAEHCRLGRRTVQRIERAELTGLSLDKIDLLAKGLGVRTGSLLGNKPVTRREPDTMIRELLAENLVRIRMRRGWSQQDLADRSGVSRPAIAHIEREARNASIDTMTKLGDALQTSVEKLLSEVRK